MRPPARPPALPRCLQARAMIVKRGERMGMDFQAEIDALKTLDLEAELAAVADPTVEVGLPSCSH